MITCREPNIKFNYDRSSEVAKVNKCTQNVNTQQKECEKGRGAPINIIKLGLTFFLDAGKPGPEKSCPKKVSGLEKVSPPTNPVCKS